MNHVSDHAILQSTSLSLGYKKQETPDYIKSWILSLFIILYSGNKQAFRSTQNTIKKLLKNFKNSLFNGIFY